MAVETPGTMNVRQRESSWTQCEADEFADVIVQAMALGGVDRFFFTSGSDILIFQEAVAKAQALGRPTPELITVIHEAVSLNAAIGYSMVSRRPAATAAHVDVGTLNYGCALHTAKLGNYPVLMISGAPATALPGSHRGARDHHIQWIQENHDNRELTRAYSKWQWRLQAQDNPGLIVSRALQAALADPRGPAFLTVPREVGMTPISGSSFPTVDQLGKVRPPGPDPAAIDELAGWLLEAERPLIVLGTSGSDPDSVSELVRVAELVGASVTDNAFGWDRLNFPMRHPLFETGPAVAAADCVLVIDRRVPWIPAGERELGDAAAPQDPRDLTIDHPLRAPSAASRVAWIAHDPGVFEVPVLELESNLRITSDPRLALRALAEAIEDRRTSSHVDRAGERLAAARARQTELSDADERAARAVKDQRPIHPAWAAYRLGRRVVRDESILLDEALTASSLVHRFCLVDRPGSLFGQVGSGGGWGSGAAIGAKLAEPERDVILASGDGFYTFGSPAAALWTAIRCGAPYLAAIFVNGSYSTGTTQVDNFYPDGYAARAGHPGGRFAPPPDFAAEARAAGAHGETVTEPEELDTALDRALDATRAGQPAVVAIQVSS